MSEQETSQTVAPVELEIVYQDEYFVAVNKPAGMLVHRSWLDKHETQFVMQTLRDQIGQHVFPLHRLDRPTSGVLVFALSSEVASQVMPMFAEHKMEKTYHAIVRGWIEEEGVLDYALKVELDKIADKFASQEKEAQEAVTAYKPLTKVEVPYSTGKFPTTRYCLMEMKPKTGRKHQLRRHMAHLRHPIVGDTSHGDGKHNKLFRNEFDSHRLLLHASELRFVHPFTNEELVMKASIDDTWQQLFTRFEWDVELVK
ncbi:TPA: tRNA pseudouridine(65) synthase TruC [Vibrio parahaemolyticus]|uniref:tRNA pseudouridine(65) synthase TruC n=1 Tax=Vibrio parahaemolyticus TaxID=670 RepID=UPI0015DFC06E|nr:tRNA pseudouridine(65) synthase TruC [Vibrio parahaemolyticus]MBM4903929.1 tRNA pseudouridine(65) synthase TruC [Vibrio parahaemolyticus]MCC4217247.1 tRNA pseudouridine(65) synthase TruC [Vibrio parahaemolyticus]MDF4644690.1 tRNA pseudouridine(65) synthase TruC [Vibrio parahaemolyticus]HCG6850559.1 tRNA pseudouridine(65) synthase TruC [Vibrio parahaemolyticus]HCM0817242.1 tRNA pseudouridine(65) synthase TruC [Vibrio parahaemolyticus]